MPPRPAEAKPVNATQLSQFHCWSSAGVSRARRATCPNCRYWRLGSYKLLNETCGAKIYGVGVIEFESVGKTFRDGTAAVVDLTSHSAVRQDHGNRRPFRLRQDHHAAHGQPDAGAHNWPDPLGRHSASLKRKTTLRRQMGYVIQSGGLFPHRTVLDNIGTVPSLLHWQKKKIEKRAFELLDSVGLERKLAQRYPVQLSGGQQQRVGVARALAADPLVMLMDEPFSAVDPVVRSELHEFFLGLQRELSKTIILITHDIDEAIKLGDQVAIMRVGGHLAQVGTPQQLLDEPADAFVEGSSAATAVFGHSRFSPRARSAWIGSRWSEMRRLPEARHRFWWSTAMLGRLVGRIRIAQVGSSARRDLQP